MPTVQLADTFLYYETVDEADPGAPWLALVHGLGFASNLWYPQVPELSRRFRLLLFDNRGCGRSDLGAPAASGLTGAPGAPATTGASGPSGSTGFTMATLAEDLRGLLDHLGIGRTHLLGLSMGGYVAQEFALAHPERVDRLVLASTHAGGPEYLAATRGLWAEVLDVAGLTVEQVYRKALRYTAAEGFLGRAEEVERFIAARMEHVQPAHAFQAQFLAAAQFDARERLGALKRPTLVVHGTEDRVVPPRFAEDLAARIPGARLAWIEGAAHLAFLERPEVFNRIVTEFLTGTGSGGAGAGGGSGTGAGAGDAAGPEPAAGAAHTPGGA